MTNRIFRYIATLIVILSLCYKPLSGQEYIGGLITENKVYSPSLNPYIVIETLIVPEGVTLTILPGTEFYFMIRTSLRIEGGTLVAEGTPENPILFDSHSADGLDVKKWDGISISLSRTVTDEQGNYLGGNILRHCTINHTTTALALSDSSLIHTPEIRVLNGDYGIYLQTGSSLVLKNSVIDACSYGMYIKNSGNNIITGCQITNCDIGIFFPSNNISKNNLIANNNISYNRNIGLFMSIGQGNIRNNLISGNTVSYNNIGLHIGNGGTSDYGFNTLSNNIIRNNDIGLKLSQDTDTLRGNLIEHNETALMLSRASLNSLEKNIIRQNSGWGLLLTDGSVSNKIMGNNIYENSAGIRVTHKDAKHSVGNLFEFNMVSANQEAAFLFESGPQAGVHHNSISSLRDTAVFINLNAHDLQATENWWFTTDTLVIDKMIFDFYDQPEMGEVIYKPFIYQPDPEVPVSKPRMVVKRLVEGEVIVNWLPNPEPDLAGYKVYYGLLPDGGFEFMAEAGSDTVFVLNSVGFGETIAVTAYDTDATGWMDQENGHESAYSIAIAGPWSGGDAVICQDKFYTIDGATAIDYSSLYWETDGDGAFADPLQLHTRYVPGPSDVQAGKVNLTLNIVNGPYILNDRLQLTIMGQPEVFAGNDTVINPDGGYVSSSATALNYTNLYWTTTGDGEFDDNGTLLIHYHPGQEDLANGFVILTLHLESECGDITGEVKLTVKPAFSISGRLHCPSGPVSGGIVVAFNRDQTGTRAVDISTTADDGAFNFEGLTTGSYYLFALGNPALYAEYAPSYYAAGSFWEPAYLLPLNTDVYDVDIHMKKIETPLPEGTGSISGIYTYMGDAGRDGGIYNMPWFAPAGPDPVQPGYNPAANHVVYLMNSSLTHILGWSLTSMKGEFLFDNLPFGSYRLWGEKAGYKNALSPLITLSPAQPDIEEVIMSVNNQKIEISVPKPANYADELPVIFPNPANEKIWIRLPWSEDRVRYSLEIYNMTGKPVLSEEFFYGAYELPYSLDVSGIKAGAYLLVLRSEPESVRSLRLSIVR